MKIFLFALCCFSALEVYAQDPRDLRWGKECLNASNVATCRIGTGSFEVPGISSDEMASRLRTFLEKQLSSATECTFSEETLDLDDYPVCWTQSAYQQKENNKLGRTLRFTVERMNPNPDKQDYKFECIITCKNEKFTVILYYRNQFNNIKFYNDPDGNDDPVNARLYKRFDKQYRMMMGTILKVVQGEEQSKSETPGNAQEPEKTVVRKKRLN